jgi:hypothetical protein
MPFFSLVLLLSPTRPQPLEVLFANSSCVSSNHDIMQRALVALTPTEKCDHEQNLIQYESAELFEAKMNFVFRV